MTSNTGEIAFVGASGFIHPEFLQSATQSGNGILDATFHAESKGRSVFMNYKEVAKANRHDDLRLLNFFGAPPGIDLGDASTLAALETGITDPNTLAMLGTILEAWTFFHKGFRIREIWFETAIPLMIQFQLQIGFRVHQATMLPDGKFAQLLRITREEAVEAWPTFPGSIMVCPRPRFGFTRAEQKLLEMALLDCSDRDAATELHLSADAVKKRWRSIYAKISRVEPAILPAELTGADQRRALLKALRNSLQEIRPF